MYKQNNAFETLTIKQMQLLCTLERLWIEHVLWTRAFLVSTASGFGDLGDVTNRLLRNPQDFADALRPFYGARAQRFGDLLKEHLLIAGDLVNAAKAGDAKTASQLRMRWYANADSIADLLGSINPYWNSQAWRTLLYDHLKMTEDEATQILKGQYAQSIAQYDAIQNEAVRMGEYMAAGIMDQFRM
jgi:hypothetical protein